MPLFLFIFFFFKLRMLNKKKENPRPEGLLGKHTFHASSLLLYNCSHICKGLFLHIGQKLFLQQACSAEFRASCL